MTKGRILMTQGIPKYQKFQMKTKFTAAWTILLCALALNITGSEPARSEVNGTRYIVGLSPFLDTAVKDDVYRRVIGFLLADVPLGSSVWIYDAYNLRTITQIEIPNLTPFKSAKTRANQFAEPIHKLKQFLAATNEIPSTPALPLNQAVRFPQFMDFVAENLARGNHSTAVIVLGSPLYLDPKEPAFSMVDGYFPSDGHLGASRAKTVFGLKERANALTGVSVHYGYFGDPWVTQLHQDKIARFWSLYLKGQGARLVSFCGDLPTIFNAAKSNASGTDTDNRYEIDPSQTKVEMLRISRDVHIADWITRDVLSNISHGPPSITVGPMKIGIRWQGNIDIDLYAAAKHDAERLYFEHTRAPEGYYFKDHRSSPDREYEFIEFESPVDVWQVEAKINFYEGRSAGGPSGEIRIEFDGKIFTGNFAIAAPHGNHGREGSRQRDYWAVINVPEILKLAPKVESATAE
jgi:hypothetical protein